MAEPPYSDTLQADWYDGHSARARPVQVRLQRGDKGPALWIKAQDHAPQRIAPEEIGWPERWSRRKSKHRLPTALTVDLGASGSLKITDIRAWHQAEKQAGRPLNLAERMLLHWRIMLGVSLFFLVCLWVFYRLATPWLATQLTRRVPLGWELSLSDKLMQQLDANYFKPSQIQESRQTELEARFKQLAQITSETPSLQPYRNYRPRLRLLFRDSPALGANALALPGGTIVMTDALIKMADATDRAGDDALLGILGHEIGHVQMRHTTRTVVEQAVLNVGLGLTLGDVSIFLSGAASALTGLAYSRGHEAAADCYGLQLLGQAKVPTPPLGNLLLVLDGHDEAALDDGIEGSRKIRMASWLSTHPDTLSRAQKIRDGIPIKCPG